MHRFHQSLQFYIHGISVDETVVGNDNNGLPINSNENLVESDSSKDSFVHVDSSVENTSLLEDQTGSKHHLPTDRHSVTSVYVAGDSDVLSSSASHSSQSQTDHIVELKDDIVGNGSDHDELIPITKVLSSSSDRFCSDLEQTVNDEYHTKLSTKMCSILPCEESDLKSGRLNTANKDASAENTKLVENTKFTTSPLTPNEKEETKVVDEIEIVSIVDSGKQIDVKDNVVEKEIIPIVDSGKQIDAKEIHRDAFKETSAEGRSTGNPKLENSNRFISASTRNSNEIADVVADDKETLANVRSNRLKAKNIFKKVVNSRMIAADQTVTARLSRLERSIFDLMKQLPAPDTKSTEGAHVEELVTSIASRLNSVEQFLHGFEDNNSKNLKADNDSIDCESQCNEENPVEQNASTISQEFIDVEPDTGASDGLKKVQSLVFHLNERDNKTLSSIEELEKQITDLQVSIGNSERRSESPMENLALEVETAVSKLSEGLNQKISHIAVSVEDKVSNEDFLRETNSIRDAIESYSSRPQCETAAQSEQDVILENRLNAMSIRVNEIDDLKLDKVKFDEVMEQNETSFRSLIIDEISKNCLDASDGSEALANEVKTLRAMVDSQTGPAAQRDESVPQTNSNDKQMGISDVDDLIQQATNSVRESLEGSFTKKLDELKCMEHEIDALVSQLAEKPSQEQIDSMLQGIEASISERFGQDKDMQLMIKSIKDGE